MLLDYPYYGGLCGLEKYMEEGPEKGICTTLYEDDRKLDGSGYAPHLVELYSLCDISVCIKDTEIPLCEIEKVRKSGDWGVFKEKRWVMLLSGYKEPV